MRQQTRELALASVLGALAVLFLFLGGVLPLALYACPLLASACLLPVREECRASYQWCCFFAAAILGLLLGPDKESALLFCFLGLLPGSCSRVSTRSAAARCAFSRSSGCTSSPSARCTRCSSLCSGLTR